MRLDSKKRLKGLPKENAAPHQQKRYSPTPTSPVKHSPNNVYKYMSPLQSPNKRSKHYSYFSPNHTPEQRDILHDIKCFFKGNNHILYMNYGKNTLSKCYCLKNTLAATSFKMFDSESGWNFLIDTGACRSFVPKPKKKTWNLSPYEGPPIITANGQNLKIFGCIKLHIKLANRKYTWTFVVADTALPILGADFLAAHKLAVDMADKRLITRDELKPRAIAASTQSASLHPAIQAVLNEFRDVFSSDLKERKNISKTHSAIHRIHTNSAPLRSKFRRLNPEKLAIAKKVFQELEEAGICQKAPSPWASPLHMVKKNDGSYRPCGDYRRLNTVTEPDHYPLPNISDITNVLGGAKIFSKIDLTKGYHQVPIHPDDIPKTAICTPFGTEEAIT